MSGEAIYDKSGRRILPGDILKVFHCVGARNKRHYMYKQALGFVTLGPKQTPYMKIGHLTFDEKEHYHQYLDGRMLRDYEIVQSINADFEDRPKELKP